MSLVNYEGGEPILTFDGEHSFLSNFYFVEFSYEGYQWRSVEHAYQWSKDPTDENARFFYRLPTAGAAKRAGRDGFRQADWDIVKRPIMLSLLRLKFQVPELKELLLATDKRWLEEGNTWGDTFWGVCPPGSGNGQNVLGKMLMLVRDELRTVRDLQ